MEMWIETRDDGEPGRRRAMSRLIIVSNRLPFTAKVNGPSIELSPSAGGLVTALSGYLDRQREEDPSFESLWVGWPGSEIPGELQEKEAGALAEHHASP